VYLETKLFSQNVGRFEAYQVSCSRNNRCKGKPGEYLVFILN